MRWLRDFFYDKDPIVKVAAGLSEPEALMYRELLENNGVAAMVKNMNVLSVTREFGSMPGDFDILVKQSDLGRAREVLRARMGPDHLIEESDEA
jgi:hypothetical protein